jgi:hypothetical protein
VSGTRLLGVLEARYFHRYRPIRLDDGLPHHAEWHLLPDQPGSRPVFVSAFAPDRVTP